LRLFGDFEPVFGKNRSTTVAHFVVCSSDCWMIHN
jgi:hypothetical protein